MAQKQLISPQVYTFETDVSDYVSNQKGAKALPGTTTTTSNGGGTSLPNNNNNNNTDFILCEDFTRLLQEDGGKLTI
jgi:hypothetical protein